MSAVSLLSFAALVSLPHSVVARTPAESVATGAHFRVTVHFDAPKLAEQALEAAEASWPFTVALLGGPIEPKKPLEIHLYRTVEEYERVEAELTQGRFKANLAFTSDSTGAAHIALQPPLTDAALARTGLPTMTRHQIAHEAMHVACTSAWSNASTLPTWFDEGSATWVSQQALTKHGWIASGNDDPMFSTYAVVVKRLEAEKKLPTFAQIFDDLLGERSSQERYAVWLHAFRFLREGKHAAALAKIVDAARMTGGGGEHAAAVTKAAKQALGGDAGLSAKDKEFAAYVRALKPAWDEVHRSLSTTGEAWFQAPFASWNAMSWRTEDVGSTKYEVSGEVEVLDGEKRQMNLLLGRTPNGFVQISWVAGYGVTVFEYDNRRLEDAQWKKLGGAEVPAFTTNQSTPFRVRVSKSKITIELAGKNVCEVDAGDHAMSGACGLGALSGSAGAWRKFSVKKS